MEQQDSSPLQSPSSAQLQPTWRYWGEERSPEAVHGVYLKKVRYHRPSRSLLGSTSSSNGDVSSDNLEEDPISHLEWETVRVRQIKAGTLPSLVSALASEEGELESTYVNVFLATYRAFSTADEVLALLLRRYESLATDESLSDVAKGQHRKTLVLAMHVWLDTYPEDFRCPPHHPLLSRLKQFCSESFPGSELELKANHRLDKWHREDEALPLPEMVPNGIALASLGSIVDVEPRKLAQQLTWMDVDVFRRLVPHQCLGVVWARGGEKGRASKAPTVLATIQQFNAVSRRLVASAVDPSGPPAANGRAKLLIHWIDVAQELRLLKNFSSLKAIVSGLQAHPVFRLRRVWQHLPADKLEVFEELAKIFSEENNREAQRELLIREGTAKFAATAGVKDRHLQRALRMRRQDEGTTACHGTVPYLGTFLTDLTMLDAAVPDTLPGGLLNFDKRRREFEVLAQIKLLQGAANAYRIEADMALQRWFKSLPVFTEKEAHALSLRMEPATASPASPAAAPNPATHSARRIRGHRKTDSLASTNSSSSGSHFYCDLDSLLTPEDGSSAGKAGGRRIGRLSSSSSCSSLPSLDTSGMHLLMGSNNVGITPSKSGSESAFSSPDFYIIRIHAESEPASGASSASPAQRGQVMYKSILLGNNERTPQVIANAMGKLGVNGRPEDYELVQILPHGGEMVLPSGANVYYAINTAHDMHFLLRPKHVVHQPQHRRSPSCGSVSPSTSLLSSSSSESPAQKSCLRIDSPLPFKCANLIPPR